MSKNTDENVQQDFSTPRRMWNHKILWGCRDMNIHIVNNYITDEVLPAFLNYMRNPPPGSMPPELWRALTAQTVEQADDSRLSDAAFNDGYEVATQWEAVARMMQFRARRDAAKARELLIYVQAVDKPTTGSMEKLDYRKALEIVNYIRARSISCQL